jgi:hypothetical protein
VIQPLVVLLAPTDKLNPLARELLIATLIVALRRPTLPKMRAIAVLAAAPYIGTQQPFNTNQELNLVAATVRVKTE